MWENEMGNSNNPISNCLAASVTISPCWLWEIVFTLGTRTHGFIESISQGLV